VPVPVVGDSDSIDRRGPTRTLSAGARRALFSLLGLVVAYPIATQVVPESPARSTSSHDRPVQTAARDSKDVPAPFLMGSAKSKPPDPEALAAGTRVQVIVVSVEDGSPIQGALLLISSVNDDSGSSPRTKSFGEAKTDSSGTWSADLHRAEGSWSRLLIEVRASGFVTSSIVAELTASPVVVRLTPGLPTEILVVDETGAPAVGVPMGVVRVGEAIDLLSSLGSGSVDPSPWVTEADGRIRLRLSPGAWRVRVLDPTRFALPGSPDHLQSLSSSARSQVLQAADFSDQGVRFSMPSEAAMALTLFSARRIAFRIVDDRDGLPVIPDPRLALTIVSDATAVYCDPISAARSLDRSDPGAIVRLVPILSSGAAPDLITVQFALPGYEPVGVSIPTQRIDLPVSEVAVARVHSKFTSKSGTIRIEVDETRRPFRGLSQRAQIRVQGQNVEPAEVIGVRSDGNVWVFSHVPVDGGVCVLEDEVGLSEPFVIDTDSHEYVARMRPPQGAQIRFSGQPPDQAGFSISHEWLDAPEYVDAPMYRNGKLAGSARLRAIWLLGIKAIPHVWVSMSESSSRDAFVRLAAGRHRLHIDLGDGSTRTYEVLVSDGTVSKLEVVRSTTAGDGK